MKKFFFIISIIAALTTSVNATGGSLIATGIIKAPSDNSVSINGILYFAADDKIHGVELWKSDGTEAGAVMVKDINPNGNSYPVCLTDVNGILLFQANDGTHGTQLWKSDGTEAGTEMVKDINPYGGSYPVCLTNVNGTLFFQANDGMHGAELWKSDGYEAGTEMVKDINPNGSSYPSDFKNIGGRLFFQANDGTHGTQSWVSDGYEAGTEMVKNASSSSSGSYSNMSMADDKNDTVSFVGLDVPDGYFSMSGGRLNIQDCELMASKWLDCDAYIE